MEPYLKMWVHLFGILLLNLIKNTYETLAAECSIPGSGNVERSCTLVQEKKRTSDTMADMLESIN